MEKKTNIRLLTAEEIDVRVGAIYKNGITLLLYKDARVDMNILDEIYGPYGWMRKHVKVDDVMFCELLVKDPETGNWISKMDVGTPSYSEPLKGAASDAFKRAATNLGIGRELYTSPFIWVDINKVTIKDDGTKKSVKDSFSVQSIEFDEVRRNITGLVIVNQDRKVVFQYMESCKQKQPPVSITITAEQTAQLMAELRRTGISLPGVLRKYKLKQISDMSPELWQKAMTVLRETSDKAA